MPRGIDAQKDLSDVQFSLGHIHDCKGEFKEALEYYKLAGENGHAVGQFNVGIMLCKKAAGRNLREAEKWLKESQKNGYPPATETLGEVQFHIGYEHYNKGEFAEALKYFRLASENGDEKAKANVQIMTGGTIRVKLY